MFLSITGGLHEHISLLKLITPFLLCMAYHGLKFAGVAQYSLVLKVGMCFLSCLASALQQCSYWESTVAVIFLRFLCYGPVMHPGR